MEATSLHNLANLRGLGGVHLQENYCETLRFFPLPRARALLFHGLQRQFGQSRHPQRNQTEDFFLMLALTDPTATLCGAMVLGFAFGLLLLGNRRRQ